MKKMKEKDCSAAWWAELEELGKLDTNLDWCCKLIMQTGFEDFIQDAIGRFVTLRFSVYYCPHCGRLLKKEKPHIDSKACCYLFKDLGLEALQYEEPKINEKEQTDYVVHRIIMKYCFNCGNEINWDPGDDPKGWAGESSCDCNDCDGC